MVDIGRNRLVAEDLTVIQDNYRISFDLRLSTLSRDTANIFHFTTGGFCCAFGTSVPALFVNRLNLRWIAGNPSWPQQDLAFNLGKQYVWYHIDLKVVNGTAYVYVDKALRINPLHLASVGATQSDVKLYMGSGAKPAANGQIKNFGMYEDATVW